MKATQREVGPPLEKGPPMTAEEFKDRIEMYLGRIRRTSKSDPEAAHSTKDSLYQEMLAAIAHIALADGCPKAIALHALKAEDVKTEWKVWPRTPMLMTLDSAIKELQEATRYAKRYSKNMRNKSRQQERDGMAFAVYRANNHVLHALKLLRRLK